MSNNNIVLNRLFTQQVFRTLVEKNTNSVYKTIISEYIKSNTQKNNISIISEIYKYMHKYYRNEYIYINTMFNKWLLGKHSLNTTTALTQIPVGKSKADFILINGKAVVYEIKTELDTLNRLDGQIKDYYKAFKYVSIVSCKENYEKIYKLYGNTSIGIYIFNKSGTISEKKKPVINNKFLDYKTIFYILNKNEYEDILLDYYGEKPKVSNIFYYETCFNWIKEIPMDILYKNFIIQLKKRNKTSKVFLDTIPYELKSLIYFSKWSMKEQKKIEVFFNNIYGG